MATINEWNAEKLEEYSSLYPWLGTEVFLVVGVASFFFSFFAWLSSDSIEKITIKKHDARLIAVLRTSLVRRVEATLFELCKAPHSVER